MKPNYIPCRLTLQLLRNQNFRCYYCNKTFSTKDGDNAPSVEHIIPKSLGKYGKENIALACRHCNTSKGSLSAELFLLGFIRNKGGFQKIRGPRKWYHGDWIKW